MSLEPEAAAAAQVTRYNAQPAATGTPMTEPLALRAPEAARMIGISTRSLWTLTNRGDVPHVRFGRTVVYPIEQLRDWLSERAKRSTRRQVTRADAGTG